ncbi:MAG: AAA family ATPase [Patescibacteria group bacterium]
MLNKLTEAILPLIMGIMVHRKEVLSPKAQRAQNAYLAKLEVNQRKTKKPVVVGFLGLVGSGKSSVAKDLVRHIGGTVVEGDAIRVCLRKEGERYKYVRQIAENVALEVLKQGGNVVFDSDQADQFRHFENSEAFCCSLAPPSAGLASQKALYFGIKS